MTERQDRLTEIKARMASFSGPLEQNQLEVARAIDRDLPWLVGEAERLRGRLRELEWAGGSGCEYAACPIRDKPT